MEFNKSGIIKSPASSITNLYSGTQENYYNMSLTYNYKTDVFKEYGFDTCLRLDSPGENDTPISYSYFLPINGWEPSTKYVLTCYYYNASPNGLFDIHLEQGSKIYASNYYRDTWYARDESNRNCVKFMWVKFTSDPDGKVWIMLYPRPGSKSWFTSGYQLVAGINIYKGTKVYPPSYTQNTHGIYELSKSCEIHSDYVNCNSIIET